MGLKKKHIDKKMETIQYKHNSILQNVDLYYSDTLLLAAHRQTIQVTSVESVI